MHYIHTIALHALVGDPIEHSPTVVTEGAPWLEGVDHPGVRQGPLNIHNYAKKGTPLR